MKKIIVLMFLIQSLVYSQWVIESPVSPYRYLNSFDFYDVNNGWAVGDTGTIMRTTDGGYNWDYQNLNSGVTLHSIKAISSNTAILCGDSGKIYKTINGGINWIQQNIGVNGNLFSLFLTSLNTIYCAATGKILKSTNSGINWSSIYSSSINIFTSVSFINQQTGWVSSSSGVLGKIFKTTDGGNSWDSTTALPIDDPVYKIYFASENTGWGIQAGNQRSMTTDGGINWTTIVSYGGFNVNSIYFFDTVHVWGAGGGILYSTDGWFENETWYTFNPNLFINNILFKGSQSGWAIGSNCNIYKTENSGAEWQNIAKNIHSDMKFVQFLNENTGYISETQDGSLIKTTNGGINWTRIKIGSLDILGKSYFVDPSTGYTIILSSPVHSAKIAKTTNGGISWNYSDFNTTRNLNAIHFFDANKGYCVCDSGLILKTFNGGLSWETQQLNTTNNLIDVKCTSLNSAFCCGSGMVLRSTNDGLNWVTVDTTLKSYFYNIDFLNANTGWIASMFYNRRLIKTTNAGDNWITIADDSSYILFNSVQFLNENTGWAINSQKAYKSTDGGLTWTSQIIFQNKVFYWGSFINENTGWVVGTQGYICKTTNGGFISVQQNRKTIPSQFSLSQNYPNPFNPSTKIKFSIPSKPLPFGEGIGGGVVKLTIYDLLGREVATLVNESLQPGTYEAEWDATNYASGIYFYKLETGTFSQTKKMVLIK